MRRNAYLFDCFCPMIHLSTNYRKGDGEEEEGGDSQGISVLVVVVGVGQCQCHSTEIEAGPGNTNTVGPGLLSALNQHNWLRTVLVRKFQLEIFILTEKKYFPFLS